MHVYGKTIVAEGKVYKNIYWSLDSDNTMTISGNGSIIHDVDRNEVFDIVFGDGFLSSIQKSQKWQTGSI